MAVALRLFSLGPRIRKCSSSLSLSTAWRVQLLTLGAYRREVTVDPRSQILTIRRRRFWILRSELRISFSNIAAVTYGYQDQGGGWDADWTAHNALDHYTVGVRLKSGRELTLFHFVGAGSFVNNSPWPDWMYWGEDAVVVGAQDTESRTLVELLSRLIGVSVTPPNDA